jgi:hypothetical protein
MNEFHLILNKIQTMEIFNLIFNLFFGLLIIGIGFLVKLFPNTIAGYNTMSKEQKKNVDIEKASTFLRNGFFIIGLSIIIGYFLLNWMDLSSIANSIGPILLIIGLPIIIIMIQKYDHNKKIKK